MHTTDELIASGFQIKKIITLIQMNKPHNVYSLVLVVLFVFLFKE